MNDTRPLADDAQLISLTLGGCQESFGQLVIRYQDRLYNSMVHLLRNEVEAEDVVQDAFVLAMTRLDSFRGRSSFFTWLYRIAFNAAISQQRKKRPSLSVQNDLPGAGLSLKDRGPQPTQRLEDRERAGAVMKALDRLSQEHRAILVLREMDGLCYDEIADILDLPIGTVRSRLHRARTQLRSEMEKWFAADRMK